MRVSRASWQLLVFNSSFDWVTRLPASFVIGQGSYFGFSGLTNRSDSSGVSPKSQASRVPACVAQIEIPFSFFYCFFFMNPSPSAQNPISQPLKKGKSQLPFYPFTTLVITGMNSVLIVFAGIVVKVVKLYLYTVSTLDVVFKRLLRRVGARLWRILNKMIASCLERLRSRESQPIEVTE